MEKGTAVSSSSICLADESAVLVEAQYFIVRSFLDSFEQLVNLGCHNEIVLMQAIDLMGLKLHFAVAPTDADVRVMALDLAQFADLLGEAHRVHEVLEPEGSFDFCRFVFKLPLWNLA